MSTQSAQAKITQALEQISLLLTTPVVQNRDFLRVALDKARTALSVPDPDGEDVLAVLSDLFEVQGSPTVQQRPGLSDELLSLVASLEDAEAAFSEVPSQPIPQA